VSELARLPTVTIEYCEICGYGSRATRLAAAIETEFGVKAELIQRSGGVFEVTVDGELVYSKRATGRFPGHDEVFYHVKQATKAG
jgi:selenoprotein W-related protein